MAFLDVEASGLGAASYPIEVGWAREDNRAPGSVLIRPEPGWTHWDKGAERFFHRIPRSLLLAQGLTVSAAAAAITDALAGCRVHVDAPEYDRMWMARLFGAAGKERPRLDDANALFDALLLRRRHSMERVRRLAGERFPHTHRAGADARNLLEIYLLLRR